MNAYLPICVVVLAVFGTAFANPQQEQGSMQSTVDYFYEHFQKGRNVPEMLDEALNGMDLKTQYEHIQYINDLANQPNEKQEFARQVLQAAQAKLDTLLRQIGYEDHIDVKDYIEGLYQIQTTNTTNNPDVFNKLMAINELHKEYNEKLAVQETPDEQKQCEADVDEEINNDEVQQDEVPEE